MPSRDDLSEDGGRLPAAEDETSLPSREGLSEDDRGMHSALLIGMHLHQLQTKKTKKRQIYMLGEGAKITPSHGSITNDKGMLGAVVGVVCILMMRTCCKAELSVVPMKVLGTTMKSQKMIVG